MRNKIRITRRPPTPEERARYAAAYAEEEAAMAENSRLANRHFDQFERSMIDTLRKTGVFDLSATIAALKASREAQGLTLADVSAASGMSVPALSSLETGRNDNPTLRTLQRYAAAIGRRLVIGVIEDHASVATAER
ncbi:MAG: helix-turn-helix transcriptional regulator [Planctomycetaceae bacterium]